MGLAFKNVSRPDTVQIITQTLGRVGGFVHICVYVFLVCLVIYLMSAWDKHLVSLTTLLLISYWCLPIYISRGLRTDLHLTLLVLGHLRLFI